MRIIESNTTNPYFNIATEEYLLKYFTDNCFFLYQNESSVIVGKHQNTLAEINYAYIKENKIPVIRRLSGGGTVYHDLGNINFAFLKNTENDKNTIDFKKHTQPIINLLNKLGANAKFEGHNDIRINGFKISGNAEHVFKKRVLHHGTLLFCSDLMILNTSIKAPFNKFNDKAVKSVRSRVANISELLEIKISVDEFKIKIIDEIKNEFYNISPYNFNQKDILEIQKLVTEKYSTWNWNFGYSPDYNFTSKLKTEEGTYEIYVCVEKGVIKEIQLPGLKESTTIENLLIGIRHDESTVRQTLIQSHIVNYNFYKVDQIIEALF